MGLEVEEISYKINHLQGTIYGNPALEVSRAERQYICNFCSQEKFLPHDRLCRTLYAMAEEDWYPAENGVTIGRKGSEEGTILREEEHPLGARIALERDAQVAPFAITCGIYGWMMHTRFFATAGEAEAEYGQMKAALGGLLAEAEETAPLDGGQKVLYEGIEQFVKRFP